MKGEWQATEEMHFDVTTGRRNQNGLEEEEFLTLRRLELGYETPNILCYTVKMTPSKKRIGTRLGVLGAIILPTIYLLSLLLTHDPDNVVFIPGPVGFTFWIIQWIAFLVGGWILAIIVTILTLSFIGYLLGFLLGWFIKKLG